MPKFALLALILPFLLAPIAPVLAQETGSSAEAVKDTFEEPKMPLDGLIQEWLGEGKLKETAQEGMTKAQAELQNAAGQALGTAQTAAKDEINKQANQAIQATRQKAEAYIGGVVTNIKTAVINLISKIKIFFVNLFTKDAPKY